MWIAQRDNYGKVLSVEVHNLELLVEPVTNVYLPSPEGVRGEWTISNSYKTNFPPISRISGGRGRQRW